jgi:hypothetical protein
MTSFVFGSRAGFVKKYRNQILQLLFDMHIQLQIMPLVVNDDNILKA